MTASEAAGGRTKDLYLVFDWSCYAPAGVIPEPAVGVLRIAPRGALRFSSTAHRILRTERLPVPPHWVGVSEGVRQMQMLRATDETELLADLYLEVRRAVLHLLDPRHLVAALATPPGEPGPTPAPLEGSTDPGPIREAAVREAWELLWQELEPYLDPRAYALAAPTRLGLALYNALAGHLERCELVEQAPAAALLLTEASADSLRPGQRLGATLAALLEANRHEVPAADDLPRPIRVSPGFVAWARTVRFEPQRVPRLGRRSQMRALVWQVLRLGEELTPDRLRRLTTPRAWFLFHAATLWGGPVAGRAVLADPERALAAADRALGPAYPAHVDRSLSYANLCLEIGDALLLEPERFARLRSFGRILVEANAWHADLSGSYWDRRLQAARRAPVVLPPPPFPVPRSTTYQLTWLDTDAALIEEGRAMAHCVPFRLDRCRTGQAFLFSVRDAAGRRVATVEMTPEGGVQELRGPKNAPAPEEVRRWLLAG